MLKRVDRYYISVNTKREKHFTYLIIEVTIKPQYIGIAKMRLNLYFSSELMFNLRLLKLALEKNL